MKRQFKLTVTALLAIAALGPALLHGGETNRLNGVVAIVNDAIITAQQVYARLEDMIQPLRERYSRQPAKYREEFAKLEAAALDSLIEQELVLSDYKTAGFNIPETLIDDQFQQNMIGMYGDRVSYVKTLQKQGKTIEEAKKEFRNMLIIQIMSAQKIRNQITISPFKIERYYQEHKDTFTEEERVKLRMIILPSQGPKDSVAIDRANDLHRQIVAGASFEELAKLNSIGVQAKDGGMMGWNNRKELRKELIDTAFSLAAGAVSNPIVTDDAIFILKAEETQTTHVRPLAEVRDEIEQTLKAEESAYRRKQWIDSIRMKSFVRLF